MDGRMDLWDFETSRYWDGKSDLGLWPSRICTLPIQEGTEVA